MTVNACLLIVDDDSFDTRFISNAIRKADDSIQLEFARDGADAIKRLEDGPKPKIILTDLNMPRMNGHELIRRLRDHKDWKKIPTIVLSTSTDQKDVDLSYEFHANAYLSKPDNLSGYDEIGAFIKSFWLEHVRLPS